MLAALLGFAFSPGGASAAPQGPWQLPATDLSATGQSGKGHQLTTAPDGTTTAIWSLYNGINTTIQAATRPPGGAFGVPAGLSATASDSFSPQITTAPDGTTTAVWLHDNGSNEIAQAATRPPGGAFGTPVDLSVTGQSVRNPQITAAPDGTVTAVWSRSNGSNEIAQAVTRPPGGAFGTPVDLSATGQDADSPRVTTAADGTVTAVWSRSNGSHQIVQAVTRPPGGGFGTPVDLSSTTSDAFSPQITAAPDGTVTVVWSHYNGSNQIIQAVTRPPGGGFGTPVNLSAAGQSVWSPQITAAPDGTVTAVWSHYDGGSIPIQAATRPPGGSFGTPVDLSLPGEAADYPQITAAPDGTVTAAWSRYDGSNEIVQAATRPPGGSFGNPVDLSASGQDGRIPQITTVPDGTVTAVWIRSNGRRSNNIIQTASTAPPSFLLETSRDGSGSGTVISSPPGIDCGSDCSENYRSYTEVTLTATPDPGSTFEGWGGACSEATGDTCELNVLEDLNAVATFELSPPAPTAKISKVKVSGPAKVRKGKKATYKVNISNSGNAAATGVRLKVSGRGVSFNTSVGKIGAKKTRTVKVKVKPKKPGKVKAKFKVTSGNAGGKTVKKKIKVKK